MRTLTIAETREINGGWTMACPICGKKQKVSVLEYLIWPLAKSRLSNECRRKH